jgi:amino acid adenylation domain-containing protein
MNDWESSQAAALDSDTPDQRQSDLRLLTDTERQRILVEWNRTEVAYPTDRCLHEFIEDQVGRTPEAVAVVFEQQQLTYRQLDQRANQLAHHLQNLGVGPDSLVGICVERSLEMVVGLLGILKAGGAYVPMDPEYPKDRLAFMLEDANVPVLLTVQLLAGLLPPHHAKVIRLDDDWPTIAGESTERVVTGVKAHNLAYMIYTSGSTGRPKGAMNTHVGIVNRLLWMQEAYHLTSADRVLQKTPFSFDVSVWEFFWPLLTGATLVVAVPGGHKDTGYLAELIAREKITTLHFVPSMLSAFLEQNGLASACASLKRVVCSGEALPYELQQRFFSQLAADLHNLYGPTEAAVDVTSWACQREGNLRIVPIGKPIANTRIYLLDRNLQPVPVGLPGELHIGGIGLARGYHNRPELTAEKFIADPFSDDPRARLYKTGDLARYLPDGNIEYLGRLDHQVKIRGFRIELGEIEAQLNQHPAVREVVVMARQDTPEDPRLVAYLAFKNGEPPKVSELRQMLRLKLPEYMVPSVFIRLERFPLTPNGKVDRKALPALAGKDIEMGPNYVAPRTYLEQVLCNIWRDVLKLKRVGIKDNFFDLGGHSLLAVRLIKAINGELKTNLHVPAFFQNPNIELLASLLAREQHAKPEPQLISLQPGQREGALFYLEAGMGLCRLAELFDDGPASFATITPLPAEAYLAASLGKTSELPSMEALAAPHTALIQSRAFSGPCMIIGHSFGGLLAFEVAHQLRRAGRRVDMILLLDTWGVGLPWWQKLPTLTFKSAWASITFRTWRLWQKGKAESAVLASRWYAKAGQPPTSGIVPEDVNLPFGETPWEILSKVYWKARRDYRFQPLETRALLFRAKSSGFAHLIAIDGNMGWSGLFKGGLEVVDCPGDHFTLLKGPNLQFLVQHIRRCTDKRPVDLPVLQAASAEPSLQRK